MNDRFTEDNYTIRLGYTSKRKLSPSGIVGFMEEKMQQRNRYWMIFNFLFEDLK
jgi:hypothetical protein